jgi:hypothetical protein
MNGLMEAVPREELIKTQTEAIETYLKENPLRDERLTEILQRVKKIPLTLKEVKELLHKMPDNEKTKELFSKILSDNKTLDSKEIFSEIGRLSLLGAVPVVGGLAGGIIADKVVKDNSKKSVANKFKEGVYQYFANIFLCNVGAGLFLFGMEKLTKAHIIKNLTPSKKLVGVLAGILTTGVAFGSLIANFIGKKVVDPLLSLRDHSHSLYSERKPEALDIALHVDDIATAGVLSGLKWFKLFSHEVYESVSAVLAIEINIRTEEYLVSTISKQMPKKGFANF